MTRAEVLEIFGRHRGQAIVVMGPGHASDELFIQAPAEASLYKMDMGYSAPICLGIALAQPGERVVAIEGDGSMLAALSVLTTIGRYKPPNLVVLVLDNEAYGSIWDHANDPIPSATKTANLQSIALQCGIGKAQMVRTPQEAETYLSAAMREPGPWFLVAKVLDASSVRDRIGEYDVPDIFDNSLSFAAALRRRRTTTPGRPSRS